MPLLSHHSSEIAGNHEESYQSMGRAERPGVRGEQHGSSVLPPVLFGPGIHEGACVPDGHDDLETAGAPQGLTGGLIGYLGYINERELQQPAYEAYYPDDLVGRSGIEARFEDLLRGTDGKRQVEVNALGRELHSHVIREALPGDNLVLTVTTPGDDTGEPANDLVPQVVLLDENGVEVARDSDLDGVLEATTASAGARTTASVVKSRWKT